MNNEEIQNQLHLDEKGAGNGKKFEVEGNSIIKNHFDVLDPHKILLALVIVIYF